MRIAKWCGLTVVLLSLLGMVLGLMAYSFAGFPFGGAAGVAETRAGAMRIIWAFFLAFVIGMGLVIGCRRLNSKHESRKETE